MEDIKQLVRMIFIYNALEMGWTVRKVGSNAYNKFEFIRSQHCNSLNKEMPIELNILRRRSNSEPIHKLC